MDKRIIRMYFSKLFIFLLAIFVSQVSCGRIPDKPIKVPSEARWLGGRDGGVWVVVEPNKLQDEVSISVFDSNLGDNYKTVLCAWNDKCEGDFSSNYIYGELKAFDGLKLIWGESSRIKDCLKCQ